MAQTQDRETLSRTNTRKHWALYALDAWESEHGRHEGATANDVWELVGGDESIIFTSRADAGAALRSAYDSGFAQRRTVEGEWDGPKLIAYRLTERGANALKDAGKPQKLPNRKDSDDRSLPVEPARKVTADVTDAETVQ